jgi:plastocyanin
VFIMLSNHFPSTYGSTWAWAILGGVMLLGALVRHFENTGDRSPGLVLAFLGVVLVVANSSLTGRASTTDEGGGQPLPQLFASDKGGAESAPSGYDAKTLGEIRVTVHYDGAVPPAIALAIPSTCAPGKSGPFFSNTALVKSGRVQNAFVWIDKGIDNYKDPPPAEEVMVDQRTCMYGPHVVGAMVGQRVTFLNSDPVFHNVRTIAKENATFNEAMANKDSRVTKTFTRPEIMVNAKCDVHPWMSGFVGVVAHPYFAVSNEKGEILLENVPSGDFEIAVWHEVLGRISAKVHVTPKETAKIDVALPGK